MLKKVLSEIINKNIHTRKELSASLGVSVVTVGKAVDTLISNGILHTFGKTSIDIGRKSDFIDVSEDHRILLINLCEENFSYSFSGFSHEQIDPISIPYTPSLDFADNILLLISRIKSKIKKYPYFIAIAVPGIFQNEKISDTLATDYSGDNIFELFSANGLKPDIIVSDAQTIESADFFETGDLFVYAGNNVWGTFGRGKIEKWGSVLVGGPSGLTYENALKCSLNEDRLIYYSLRFLTVLDSVISPNRILLYSNIFTQDAIRTIVSNFPSVVHITSNSPILEGLLSISTNIILKEISKKA